MGRTPRESRRGRTTGLNDEGSRGAAPSRTHPPRREDGANQAPTGGGRSSVRHAQGRDAAVQGVDAVESMREVRSSARGATADAVADADAPFVVTSTTDAPPAISTVRGRFATAAADRSRHATSANATRDRFASMLGAGRAGSAERRAITDREPRAKHYRWSTTVFASRGHSGGHRARWTRRRRAEAASRAGAARWSRESP